jgi:transposase InsO family protein
VICAFIDAHRSRFGVVPICRALPAHGCQIAPRTYWARRTRPPSARAVRDAEIAARIAALRAPDRDGRRRPEALYGSLKTWAHLRREGVRVARCTVERLMRAHGWRGVTRARVTRTTVPDPGHARAPDLVERDFTASAPGQLVAADFTYVPLDGGGFGCTAFCIDAYAGLIAGWECSLSKQVPFVEQAVLQAAARRRREGHPVSADAIHHSDAGSQYTSARFGETLMLSGLAASVGTVGDAYDNALAETTIGLYKTECTREGSPFRGHAQVKTLSDLEQITSAWVGWYNGGRLMRRLGLQPPAEAEAACWASQRQAA